MATKTRAEIRAEGAEMLLAALGIKAEDLPGLVSKAQSQAAVKPAPQPRKVRVTHNTTPEDRKFGVVSLWKEGRKNNGEWYPHMGINRRDLPAVIKELTAIYRAEKESEEAAKAAKS